MSAAAVLATEVSTISVFVPAPRLTVVPLAVKLASVMLEISTVSLPAPVLTEVRAVSPVSRPVAPVVLPVTVIAPVAVDPSIVAILLKLPAVPSPKTVMSPVPAKVTLLVEFTVVSPRRATKFVPVSLKAKVS